MEETDSDKIGTNSMRRLTHEEQRENNREDTRSRLYYRPAAVSVCDAFAPQVLCHSSVTVLPFYRWDIILTFTT